MEAGAGGIQKDLADVLHNGEADLIGLAGFGEPAQAVFRAQAVECILTLVGINKIRTKQNIADVFGHHIQCGFVVYPL